MDYGYPNNIKKIVDELEDKLIELYARVGIKISENKRREYENDSEEKSKGKNHSSRCIIFINFILFNGICRKYRVSDNVNLYFKRSLYKLHTDKHFCIISRQDVLGKRERAPSHRVVQGRTLHLTVTRGFQKSTAHFFCNRISRR